eukprot:gnl/TRDRNA2_/TRDRNA2_198545_c0_seq1.p1 gnl/TRDRNA2_/TRDRNA2_198545_c0~~gnl/TRDRNA2_/TRDRNA2_198545_c0_seq1.p1  ORF type:complete len:618 (-),score=94.39 gnl/TRDRNA2_/TRDRNA2_198545_c0_seq1:102-1955(-)
MGARLACLPCAGSLSWERRDTEERKRRKSPQPRRYSNENGEARRPRGLGDQPEVEENETGCCGGCFRRSGTKKAWPRKYLQMASTDGTSFALEVVAVGNTKWRRPGTSFMDRVSEIKEWLASVDVRFRRYRADLCYQGAILADDATLQECGIHSSVRLGVVLTDLRAAVLVVGGGVAGRRALEELSPAFQDQQLVLVDPREFSEHAGGILRAYADPAAWEALAVRHEDVASRYPNVRFLQGECTRLRPGMATVVPTEGGNEFNIRYTYCVVATGCGWGPCSEAGESLWKPCSLAVEKKACQWQALDERTVVGRRRHIVEEHRRLWAVHDRGGCVLVVGADYLGVQWACDLRHYFPGLRVTLVDEWHRCLGTLPPSAAEHAERHMEQQGIYTVYGVRYDPKAKDFWSRVSLPERGADITYVLTGVKAQNYFMPETTLSARGPGGSGGWILTNDSLQVCNRGAGDAPGRPWANGKVFAIGDCHYGAVRGHMAAGNVTKQKSVQSGEDDLFRNFAIPPIPKTAFAAASWAYVAAKNIVHHHEGWPLESAVWPSEAGIVAVSLGPHDGVVARNVNWKRDSGEAVLLGEAAAEAKRHLTWPEDREWLQEPSRWLAEVTHPLP